MPSRDRPLASVLVASLVALAALVAMPSVAHAQWQTSDPRTGLEYALSLGAGGFFNNAAFRREGSTGQGDLTPSFGAHLEIGYRFIPLLSAGVRGSFQFLGYDAGGSTDAWANAGAVGLYARIHPLALVSSASSGRTLPVDVYGGIGFDFWTGVNAFTRTTGIINIETHAWVIGTGVPFHAGIDYAINTMFSVGVYGQLSVWNAAEKGVEINRSITARSTEPFESELYGFIGVNVRGRFHLVY